MSKLKKIIEIIFNNAPKLISEPYIIEYMNATEKEQDCILFGYNDYFTSKNFGTSEEVKVKNLSGGSYLRLLCQSSSKEFTTGKIKVRSTNEKQLRELLIVNRCDANGHSTSMPILIDNNLSPYQFQSNIIDIDKKIFIDGRTHLSFKILPSTTIVFSIYPKQIGKISLSLPDLLSSEIGFRTPSIIDKLKNKFSKIKMYLKQKLKKSTTNQNQE